ncbi:pilus assembly PilX family protein [Ferrimonas senticii]|uniref:pilus assembly PilX family protein n=1 Tax=Ferrimonas senticii TaxID=394566 RepID=UPI000406A8CE|nr:pilus assembly protein [Ferrimonas senticii]
MRRLQRQAQQQGIALLSALVVLLIVSILGVAVGKQVLDSRRNTTVYHDMTNSFVRAQSALSEAQAIINDNHPSVNDRLDPASANSIVSATFASADWWKTAGNWTAAVTLQDGSNANLAGAPQYLLEDGGREPSLDLGRSLPSRRFIKVTTRANGDGQAQALVQAYVAVME